MYSKKFEVRSMKYEVFEKGQTLLELVVVIAMGVIVVGALVFATIASLRNSQFSKNQTQATKLAQEGLEKVRGLRDRNQDNTVLYNDGTSTTSKFSDLWDTQFGCTGGTINCYFVLNSSGNLIGGNATTFESLINGFTRQIKLEDGSNYAVEKKITTLVNWTDFSGTHSSTLSTLLRNPQ